MVLPGRAGHRRSFVDARDDGRQMEVSWHARAGVVVISLWQGDRCRSTFRLPVEDATALVGVLTSALTDVVRSRGTVGREPPGHHARVTGSSEAAARDTLFHRLLRRAARRRAAEIVPLRPVRGDAPTEPSGG
ncbi:MAG TPA: hypothetical protein VND62_02165 [Acidimicrobiales bacterium]|nr:hypothetical protein [Acidimicrobiales bacterium]